MAIINASYEVLADPENRRQHDRWIEEREGGMGSESAKTDGSAAKPAKQDFTSSKNIGLIQVIRMLLVPAAALVLSLLIDLRPTTAPPSQRPSDPKPWKEYTVAPPNPEPPLREPTDGGRRSLPLATPLPEDIESARQTPASKLRVDRDEPDKLIADAPQTSRTGDSALVTHRPKASGTGRRYIRSKLDPNGDPWPTQSGYLSGATTGNNSGRSNITIDNSRLDSDVFLKLVWRSNGGVVAVRLIFITAKEKFQIRDVDQGSYDVMYQDLDTGRMSRSEKFTLEEIHEENGVRYSVLTMTLYKIRGGNAHMRSITEDEFLVPELQPRGTP